MAVCGDGVPAINCPRKTEQGAECCDWRTSSGKGRVPLSGANLQAEIRDAGVLCRALPQSSPSRFRQRKRSSGGGDVSAPLMQADLLPA